LREGRGVLCEFFEYVFWVEEFGVDEFRGEEVLADDEDFGGDVTAGGLACVEEEEGGTYRELGGLVASTLLNSWLKTHIKLL
jgi:hypothetical protein